MSTSYRVSADIGGTFTDIVFQDAKTGRCKALKVLSTPENPALAVKKGIELGLEDDANVGFFIHGTTVGLNSVLTRKGAKIALVTNENFRDIYTIQGNDRGEIFSIHWKKPRPLVSVAHTYAVKGRIAADGQEVEPLNVGDLDPLIAAAHEHQYEAIAVSLLFSFQNPAHELKIAEYLNKKLPNVSVVLSHDVSPEWREFDRTSTTAMDAFTAPVVRRYLNTLIGNMKDTLPQGGAVHVMESNGGAMTAKTAISRPLQTLLSGPVGGAIGGARLAEQLGRPNLICVDMGGTSFDASLIVDGQPSTSNETSLEGLPVQMSVVDIHVIGAGGGSIGWEEANALRVGPQSAGSVPGPACYGRGGTQPTVSDANLVLRRLDAANFSGGEMQLDRAKAVESMQKLGKKFNLTPERLAQGLVDIVNAKMADAIRTITIKRGIDPRDFSLLAYGGAGPAQAAALADQLDIGEVIIPAHPGAFSAWGMLQTDMRHDFKTNFFGFWDGFDVAQIEKEYAELEQKGQDYLKDEGLEAEAIHFERSVDLRYEGQEYVLSIPVAADQPLNPSKVRNDFDAAYQQQYGHSNPKARVEAANLRVAAVGRLERPSINDDVLATPQHSHEREVMFNHKLMKTKIVRRESLNLGDVVDGPAIIEEETTTTIVPPNWHIETLTGGHMSLRKA